MWLCHSDPSIKVKSKYWEPSPCLRNRVHGSWMIEIFQDAPDEVCISSGGPKKEVGWTEATLGITCPTGLSAVDVPSLSQCQGHTRNANSSLIGATQHKSSTHTQSSCHLVGA